MQSSNLDNSNHKKPHQTNPQHLHQFKCFVTKVARDNTLGAVKTNKTTYQDDILPYIL